MAFKDFTITDPDGDTLNVERPIGAPSGSVAFFLTTESGVYVNRAQAEEIISFLVKAVSRDDVDDSDD